MKNKIMLITYADSFGENLRELGEVLDTYFKREIGAVHMNCPPCQGHFLKWGSLFFLLFCLYPVLRYPVFYHYGIL